jgi:hypothetical protein
MSTQTPASVDRLTARIAELETSNIALSGIVATVVALAIVVMGAVTLPHASAGQQAQCATSKSTTSHCRPARPRSAVRILSA